jgi:integral membrane protein
MTAPDPAVSNKTVTDEENPARDAASPGVKGALVRYRVFAYIVGVGLLALCLGMVLEYGFGQKQFVAIVAPVHGFLYIVYLILAVDLGLKVRWPITRTVLILLAGMVPFVSFIAERRVTHSLTKADGRDGRAA